MDARTDNNPLPGKIKKSTRDFVPKLADVEGWMCDDCVFITAAIMQTMAKHGIKGPNFEIGVYKGKYPSAMHHCATEYIDPGIKSFGMDVFWFSKEHEPQDTFTKLFGRANDFKMAVKNSRESTAQDIIDLCGGRPAFISIDGDHSVWPVLTDHTICGDALLRGGIIASDDFSNWAMIGMMDGIARFFLTHNRHRIVPFAFKRQNGIPVSFLSWISAARSRAAGAITPTSSCADTRAVSLAVPP
jgi:hypothetical protein